MKKYTFPIFITILGFFTAYIFYVFWHSEEVNPPKHIEKERIYTSLENKKVSPKYNNMTQKKILNVKTKNLPTPKSFQSLSNIEEEAEDVYESLLPDTQHEFKEEAIDVFDTLDSEIIEIDEKLLEEESIFEGDQQIEEYD